MRSGTKTPSHILLCGDDLVEGPRELDEIYTLFTGSPSRERLFDEALRVVRHELLGAGQEPPSSLSSFDDFRDLADAYYSQRVQTSVVHDLLLFTVQLARLLDHADNHPAIFEDISSGAAHLVGLDVGGFTASVAACARDVDHALGLGLEVIAVVARLGVALGRRSRLMESSPGAWTTDITDTDLQTIERHLEVVNDGRLTLQRAYVAVTTSTSVTVSAPPSTTTIFRDYCDEHGLEWQSPSSASTSARHGGHLPCLDVGAAIGTSSSVQTPVAADSVSLSSGMVRARQRTLRDLLTIVISNISQESCHADQVLDQCVASMSTSVKTLKLTPLGCTSRTQYLERALATHGLEPQICSPKLSSREPISTGIAIVGMSGRFPGQANDISSLWDLLLSGRTTHQEIRPSRSVVPDEEETAYPGCFLDDPGDFDHAFFRVSPKEALEADPIQRLLLMATYEALQQAGYTHGGKGISAARVGTFFGQTTTDWLSATGSNAGVHFVKTLSAFAPGRIAQFFGFGGGITTIDTACSSSLKAIHLACNALKDRECDMTIVGGGNVCVMPDMFEGLMQGGFLSPNGGCKSFRQDADGYCRGEAVGVCVLKRFEDAMLDNDNILAVIPATAANSNAGYGGSIATPSSEAQEDLFRLVLRRAGLDPHDVNAVEMHSPGTQAGDNAEMQSVLSVLATGRADENPLFATAVKAAVGHGEGAAGITSLIKAVLMLQHGQVPPQPCQPFPVNRNFSSMLQPANIKIAASPQTLAPHSVEKRRNILVNSFDAAGGNVTVLLQDPPKDTAATRKRHEDWRSQHIVSCSAETATAQAANRKRLHDWLLANPDAHLADLSYTTTSRQIHHPFRQAWVIDSIAQLTAVLRSTLDGKQETVTAARKVPLVLAFTGQGSRNVNMGLELYQSSSQFRSLLEAYQSICNVSFLPIWQGQLDLAQATVPQGQVALVALEIALANFWQSLGLEPQLLIGHSLGEFAALCVAGVLSVHEALLLVQARSEAMERLCTADEYGMLAANVTTSQAEEVVAKSEHCEIACFNAPRAHVISGPTAAIDGMEAKFKTDGIPAKRLPVRYGFHSSQMDAILAAFKETARKVRFASPMLPVVSTLSGEVVQPGTPNAFDAEYLCRQMREPVNYVGAVRAAAAERLITERSIVLELGPDALCTKLISACFDSHSMQLLPSLQKGVPVWRSISRCLATAYEAGFDINWDELYKDYAGKVRLLDLPHYAWDLKRFWLQNSPSHNVSRKTIPAVVKKEHPRTPGLPSTTLHHLDWLGFEHAGIKALFSSDLSDQVLFDAIQGHTVNGVPLFSLSLFMDMAYAAALFLFGEFGTATSTEKLKISAIQMTQGIPVHKQEDAPVVYVHVARADGQTMSVRLCTRPKHAQEVTHGTCLVSTRKESDLEQVWSESQSTWQHRTGLLDDSAETHRMGRKLFYKLFGATVRYSKEYNLLSVAHVEDNFGFGSAKLDFVPSSQQFACSPWTIEGMLQMSGFLLNANLDRPDNEIHIASRVEEFLIDAEPTLPIQFVVYAAIRETRGSTSLCDIYVCDDSRLVAFCKGIRFTKLAREAFAASLQPTASTAVSSVTPELDVRLPQKLRAELSSSNTGEQPMSLSDTLLHAIAVELGLDTHGLQDDTEFDNIGLDSMSSLKVLEKVERLTGTQLPAAFFNNFPSVGEAREALGEEEPEAERSSDPPAAVETGSTGTSDDSPEMMTPSGTDSTPSPGSPAKSRPVLVQGHASSADNPVFLIAAGTGYSDAYMNLPALASTRPIYCLESPYADDPTLHSANVPAMAAIWISTIRRLRPHGPYVLGGYSSGAVFAYEVCYQLSEAGESIDALVIMDMHFPRRLTKVYDDLIDQIVVSGFLDFPGISDRLRLHIAANSKAAVGYLPKPMKANNRPGWTEIVWATRGFSERQTCNMAPQGVSLEEDTTMEIDEYLTNARAWFVGKRSNFGTNGWEMLVGRKNVGISRVEGANHATIVHSPYADDLGRILREVIDRVTEMEKGREQ